MILGKECLVFLVVAMSVVACGHRIPVTVEMPTRVGYAHHVPTAMGGRPGEQGNIRGSLRWCVVSPKPIGRGA